MITNEILPVIRHEADFDRWVEDANGSKNTLHPVNELFAEHHMIDAVLAVMEREVRRLSVHRDLRVDVWSDLIDFFGNFVLQVHRRKEEQGLFPAFLAVASSEDLQVAEPLVAEHPAVQAITVDLFKGVSAGDWGKVLRAAHVYIKQARDHIPREEHSVFAGARLAFDQRQEEQLRLRFDELERFGLGDRSRRHYLQLADDLCRRAALPGLVAAP